MRPREARPRTGAPRLPQKASARGVAGGDDKRGRGVDVDAVDTEQLGGGVFEQWRDHGVEVGDLLFEIRDAMRQRGERCLGGR